MVNNEVISEILCSFYLKGLGDCIVADDDDDGTIYQEFASLFSVWIVVFRD